MSTIKKNVRIVDWFTPIQKKAETQDGCFSMPQPSIDPSTEETEIKTWNDDTKDREKENDFNVNAIPHDPGLRINILDYNPNDQDVVRREYVERGPCRPRSHNFRQTKFGVKSCRFNPRWFNKYDWLEYSIDKDAAFCLACYLFENKDDHVEDAFVKNGLRLKDVGELSLKLVELKKHTTFDLVYLLIKLVWILPVATASVERTFSTMTYVKNKLRNSIGDQFLNDCLVTYIEKDVFSKVNDDTYESLPTYAPSTRKIVLVA